jgi:hypothetical protein
MGKKKYREKERMKPTGCSHAALSCSSKRDTVDITPASATNSELFDHTKQLPALAHGCDIADPRLTLVESLLIIRLLYCSFRACPCNA